MKIVDKNTGKEYTFEEAEKLGIIPSVKSTTTESEVPTIEIIVDDETKSFRLSVGDKEAVDIPKSKMIDLTGYSSFRGMCEVVEDGLDDDALEELAKEMDLL